MAKRPSEALSIIARYLFSNGYNSKEIASRLEDYILTLDSSASIPKWQKAIDKHTAMAGKYPLAEIESVPISAEEMKVIGSIQGKPLQRLAFTLLCVAKFHNLRNDHNNNWVNESDKDIFSMANIQASIMRQSLMINDLYTAGLLGYSKIVDNLNLNVKYIHDDGEPVLHITDFRNLGYQYMHYLGDTSFIECEVCGLLVRRTSNRLKYCPSCAIEMDRQKASERWKRASGF